MTLQAVPEVSKLGLQRRALRLLTDAQPSFMDPLIDIYQLGNLDRSILRLHITKLQAVSCYREVGWCSAILLHLVVVVGRGGWESNGLIMMESDKAMLGELIKTIHFFGGGGVKNECLGIFTIK